MILQAEGLAKVFPGGVEAVRGVSFSWPRANPISYLIDAVRALMLTGWDTGKVAEGSRLRSSSVH